MGDLCRLFSRSTGMNIAIYIIAVMFIIVAGILYILGIRSKTSNEEQTWKTRSTIVTVVGIIVVSLLWSANMIYYEISFNRKCDALERYITRQKEDIAHRLDPVNLSQKFATNASRVVAETLTNEFKNKFARAIFDQLKTELSRELPDTLKLFNQQ